MERSDNEIARGNIFPFLFFLKKINILVWHRIGFLYKKLPEKIMIDKPGAQMQAREKNTSC